MLLKMKVHDFQSDPCLFASSELGQVLNEKGLLGKGRGTAWGRECLGKKTQEQREGELDGKSRWKKKAITVEVLRSHASKDEGGWISICDPSTTKTKRGLGVF